MFSPRLSTNLEVLPRVSFTIATSVKLGEGIPGLLKRFDQLVWDIYYVYIPGLKKERENPRKSLEKWPNTK